jgi:uncharacterized integral membrane protein
MQLFLILGIAFAIGAVGFAFQNDVPVMIMLSNWRFDSSLAVVLLVALGMGALIAALVSTPSVIEGQWARTRLRRQNANVEKEKQTLQQRLRELEVELARLSARTPPSILRPAPYTELDSRESAGMDTACASSVTAPQRSSSGSLRALLLSLV